MTTYDTHTRTDIDSDRDELRDEAPRGYEGNHVADGEVVDVDAAPTRPEARGDEPIDLEERDGVYVPTDSAEDETEDDGVDDDRRGEFRPETDEAAPLSEHLDDETEPQTRPADDRGDVTELADGTPVQDAEVVDEPDAAEQTLSDAEVAAAAGAATEPQAADSPAIGVAAVPTDGARPDAGTLWADGTADELRERWEALQLRFVDDPATVAAELRDLVGETLRTLQDELTREHAELDTLVESAGTDTELLRQAVQRHRDFHQRLLAL